MISDKLRQEFKAKHELALQECEERVRAAQLTIPRLYEIANEKRNTSFGLGVKLRQLAADDTEGKLTLRQEAMCRLDELEREEQMILRANNLPEDYLRPHYECSVCEDTGKTELGFACECIKRREREEKYASSAFLKDCFEGFRTNIYVNERQKRMSTKAMEVCRDYSRELSYNNAAGLLLMGNTGLGKTYFLNCIATAAVRGGRTVEKYTAYNFIDSIMRGIRQNDVRTDFVSSDLMIIDDLGTEPNIRNVTFEYLFAAINERVDANRAMAIATNMTSEEMLDFYGERIFSRLTSPSTYTVIALEGEDLRVPHR